MVVNNVFQKTKKVKKLVKKKMKKLVKKKLVKVKILVRVKG